MAMHVPLYQLKKYKLYFIYVKYFYNNYDKHNRL